MFIGKGEGDKGETRGVFCQVFLPSFGVSGEGNS